MGKVVETRMVEVSETVVRCDQCKAVLESTRKLTRDYPSQRGLNVNWEHGTLIFDFCGEPCETAWMAAHKQ